MRGEGPVFLASSELHSFNCWNHDVATDIIEAIHFSGTHLCATGLNPLLFCSEPTVCNACRAATGRAQLRRNTDEIACRNAKRHTSGLSCPVGQHYMYDSAVWSRFCSNLHLERTKAATRIVDMKLPCKKY